MYQPVGQTIFTHMSTPRATFMPDLLVEHFEELSFLLGQRTTALRSSSYTLRTLRGLEERIEAHIEGLFVGGRNSVGVVEAGLASESANEAFAAAYTLLRLNDASAAAKLLPALLQAAGEDTRRGICGALCVGSVEPLQQPLEEALRTAQPLVALAVLEVFAFHWQAKLSVENVGQFLSDPDPAVRSAAWNVASLRPGLANAQQTEAAVRDKIPAVRRSALQAAAWSGHAWVLEYCRKAAVVPTPEKFEELQLLCVLGVETDAPSILGLAAEKELGVPRFRLLGSYAHAGAIDGLIQAMREPDPVAAAAAGVAFTRITGVELQTVRRETLPPSDGTKLDAFDEQFLAEVELPDAKEAQEYWTANQSKYQPGQRYSQGLPVPDAPPFSEELDIVSIREACLRAAFNQKPAPTVVELARFPIVL